MGWGLARSGMGTSEEVLVNGMGTSEEVLGGLAN